MKDKIIIIGNGFDLAHGLKTSYKHMFDAFFNSLVKKINIPGGYSYDILGFQKRIRGNRLIYAVKSEDEAKKSWICLIENKGDFGIDVNPTQSESFYLRTLFSNRANKSNWCDIEEHYFETIKNFKMSYKIEIANQEFSFLKRMLINHIKNIESNVEEKDILYKSNIKAIFREDISNYKQIHVISFNYTQKLTDALIENLRLARKDSLSVSHPIFIHGQINSTSNPIIFGYGDDNSEDYNRIQGLKNNEFLKNFKTFQYLTTDRYKRVLGTLEGTNKIDVHVVGHSLGLTDKTLLKTIFHHPNVEKIEISYHDNDENYFKNLYNASRIFDDNELMRQKVVDLVNVRARMIKSY